MRVFVTCLLILALSMTAIGPTLLSSFAHSEREAAFPDGSGQVPEHRDTGPFLVVCKPDTLLRVAEYPADLRAYNEDLFSVCQTEGFSHIQEAIDAVSAPGTRILVQPGVYQEEPSLAAPTEACAALADKKLLEYDEQVQCPHLQNLIAILGDDPDDSDHACRDERLCRLQVEGTGFLPGDVRIDGAWNKLNVIRADRADGVYFKNFLVQRSEFNSLYVLETDGFVVDQVVARWNLEYGFLAFAVDHGLFVDCEGYGNGDAGIYPGSASDLKGVRHAIEITGCRSHHNMAGYSGTAGNSVYVHDNDFHDNAIGVVMDSLFPGHPGLPQDSGRFVDNRIWSNNENHYDNFVGDDAPCYRPLPEIGIEEGVVCPTAPVPVGSGFMVAGGNANLFAGNQIWDNWRYAYVLFAVPAALRDEADPTKQLDTSHFNRFIQNQLGVTPDGLLAPNGLDTWWDEGGAGNCWSDNVAPSGWRSDPPGLVLPACDEMPVNRVNNAAKLATIAPCAAYDPYGGMSHPPGCPWLSDPDPPGQGVCGPTRPHDCL